nr:MAG TPA: hypothetical protein [Herelleviridae sp.]DAJ08783.1 MAG TPA: hypothetical protein [Caudoviricetes sp.]DAR53706.1 MAG TPA: hypothetical protein [Caudoviricetes sp.]
MCINQRFFVRSCGVSIDSIQWSRDFLNMLVCDKFPIRWSFRKLLCTPVVCRKRSGTIGIRTTSNLSIDELF